MDRARIFHITKKMKKDELQAHAMRLHEVADALREYIDAIPEEVAAKLPAMPGIDRDYVDRVVDI
jgi:hypothetical protein